jgi:Xaa-Pro aminopeptidase
VTLPLIREQSDLAEKRRRVRAILAAEGAPALMLRSAAICSWYLDGARTHVSLVGPAVLAVEVRVDGDVIHTAVNEADRLIAEELPEDVEVRVGGWGDWEPPVRADMLEEGHVAGALRRARTPLLPGEVGRLRALSHDLACAVTDAAEQVRPETRESDVAALLSHAAASVGAEPVVVLVGGASRLRHRHPTPTAAPIGERAILVVGARRHGLVANLTRGIRFSAPSSYESAREAALLEVEAAFLNASRPGARLGDVFARGARAYADAGFDSEEWRRHHQGGVAGYLGRDPRAAADVDDVLTDPVALAWNPTVDGGKVEDTVLATNAGIEVLTADPRWPTVTVAGRERPTWREL